MTMGHGPSCWVNSWWVWLQKSRRTLPSCTCMARQLKLTGAWFLFDLYSLLIKFKHWSIRLISPKKRKTMSHDVSLSTTKSIQFTVCDSFDCPCQLKTVGSPRWRSFQNEPFEKTPNNWARIRHLMPPTYPHSDLIIIIFFNWSTSCWFRFLDLISHLQLHQFTVHFTIHFFGGTGGISEAPTASQPTLRSLRLAAFSALSAAAAPAAQQIAATSPGKSEVQAGVESFMVKINCTSTKVEKYLKSCDTYFGSQL